MYNFGRFLLYFYDVLYFIFKFSGISLGESVMVFRNCPVTFMHQKYRYIGSQGCGLGYGPILYRVWLLWAGTHWLAVSRQQTLPGAWRQMCNPEPLVGGVCGVMSPHVSSWNPLWYKSHCNLVVRLHFVVWHPWHPAGAPWLSGLRRVHLPSKSCFKALPWALPGTSLK